MIFNHVEIKNLHHSNHQNHFNHSILTGQNANSAALSVAVRLLKQAQKYDFTLLAMDTASYLRTQYGLRESDDRKFEEANELFNKYQKAYDAENLAETLYTTLIVRYKGNQSKQLDVSRLAGEYWERIHPLMELHKTYKLQMYGYMIGLMRFTEANDHVQALQVCDEAIGFFNSRAYEPRVPLQIFYYQRLICNIQLRQFEEGQKSAEYCLKYLQEGTFNWFKFKELYLQLSLHTGEYNKAAEILQETLANNRFEFMPESIKEIWRIYEAYIHYLVLSGKAPDATLGKKFKLARFINQTPIYFKDKIGANVAILVIKLLFMFQEGQYSKLLDQVEAMEQYCYRYLRGENTKRSHSFIKMVMQIPVDGFDPDKSIRKAEKYLKILRQTPLQLANQPHEMELIPYETLWEMIMESLQSNTVKD